MKKNISSYLIVFILVLLSVLMYSIQIMIFHASRDTFFYIVQDFAFLPLQIAIVTVVLGRYLKRREKIERLKKIYIIVNAFFNETGKELLLGLSEFSKNSYEVGKRLDVQTDWTDRMFSKTAKYLENADIQIECSAAQLTELTVLMKNKRDFLIRLLENPNLLEHDTFTDMLLSIFHITEELITRDKFDFENKSDLEHLAVDIERALKALLVQWIEYMRHLRLEYPYLYSLAVRKNPFCKEGYRMIGE